jgi:hypothetical protein
MPSVRVAGKLGPFLVLGLVAFVIGCSGETTAPPLEKGVGKQAAEEIKAERKAAAEARAAAKATMKAEMKGRGLR